MFLKVLSTVFIWASNLLADSEPPRGINLQPSRTAISLTNMWPTKWLDLASTPLPILHDSSFGVTPKKGQPAKWCLIVDLSSPQGSSVNDGINPDEFSRHYIKLDQIISMVLKHGPGALMAKFDVEAAYRNIAGHPDDQYLLGMKWRGQFFVDLALPFGLRSAPYILIQWLIWSG